MSCTFWLRRKKKAAKQLEQARLQATIPEVEKVVEEPAATIPEVETPKKPAKKGGSKNDNTETV